ncbi:MAG: hypothetical protein JWO46_2654 [Nocardioidaceae bacterium]|nr:hypothetical protein [Nocardioidaceae bacterium]
MNALSPGWHTDVAVARLGGSLVEEHADHLVVRTPGNPHYYWGNFLLVTDPTAVDDADRWLARFVEVFPDSEHRAIGLVAAPDPAGWVAAGLVIELDDVLSTDVLPEQRQLAEGYVARPLAGDSDWDEHVRLDMLHNDRTDKREPVRHEAYLRLRTTSIRALCEQGTAAWFGAFHDGVLVADLGIVDCGAGIARYQSVGTDADHRRRGLAGHLLGLAAHWAGDQGCTRWVILTESDNPAGRLYRSLGFEEVVGNVQAFRKPHA